MRKFLRKLRTPKAPPQVQLSECDQQQLDSIKIVQTSNPPEYSDIAPSKGFSMAERIIMILVKSWTAGNLAAVLERHHTILVDDNYRLELPTKNTICVVTHLVQLLHEAVGAESTTCFMGYRNSDGDVHMTTETRNEVNLLEALILTKTLDEARTLKNSTDLSTPLMQSINCSFAEFEQTARIDQQLAHQELLESMRNQVAVHHKGWRTSDASGSKFDVLLEQAYALNRKQGALLNSLAFSLKRQLNMIGLQRKRGINRPILISVISGTKLQPNEIKILQKYMDNSTKAMTSDEHSIISIHVFACYNNDSSSIIGHLELDNYKGGSQDIYDCTPVPSLLLLYGPGNLFWEKSHNSHLAEWDNITLGENDIVDVSQEPLVAGSEFNYPSVLQVRKSLGLE